MKPKTKSDLKIKRLIKTAGYLSTAIPMALVLTVTLPRTLASILIFIFSLGMILLWWGGESW